MGTSDVCRWGILGTANIARKNWKAIWNAENATLTAVASRHASRADEFISACQATTPFAARPRPLGSYEAILEDPAIDAVYLPLPTALRKEWVLRAARAGKHVLVEKPCGVSSTDVREMIATCQEQQVQFMDGVMFMHSQRLEALRRLLREEQVVGDLRRISSGFSFLGDADFAAHNIRVNPQLEPLGCLGDLGWYNIRITLAACDWQLPTRVSGRILAEAGCGDGGTTVPTEFSGELFFGQGISASFYCSFVTGLQQWLSISGTQGELSMDDFVLPFFGSELKLTASQPDFQLVGCDFRMAPRRREVVIPEYANGTTCAQETAMIRRFSANVLAHAPEPFWGEAALSTQLVLDACLQSARLGGQLVAVVE